MDECVIRPAEPGDIAAITAIYADAVMTGTATYEIEPPDAAEMARRFHGIVAGGYPYLAATLGGRLVGYAYAAPFRPRPAYRFSVENSIYVDAAMRGQGVGRRLLSTLVGEIEKGGYRQVIAVIGDGHEASPSVRLHRQAGFRHAGTIEGSGFKFGRWLDTTMMQLSLNGGTASLPRERAEG